MARVARRRRAAGKGSLRQLPSGRWQARVRLDDGTMHPAPTTFDTKLDGSAWLDEHAGDDPATWSATAPTRGLPTLDEYATEWLALRDLKPRTRESYRVLLDKFIVPVLGDDRLDKITPQVVRRWHGSTAVDTPVYRAQSYSLLRTILGTAVADDLIAANPCRIRGGGQAKRTHKTVVATVAEIQAIADAMPPRYQAMVLLAAWCGLRYGELTELRRDDVDLEEGVVHVRRAVVRVGGEYVVGLPKSEAGLRDVAIPPHILPAVESHLGEHVEPGADALVFPARHGGHMAPSALYRVFYLARHKAGRDDLRWHDLRHTGLTLAAVAGATLADLMARAGHSTSQAAMTYQHAAQGRDAAIAARLSEIAGSTETKGTTE